MLHLDIIWTLLVLYVFSFYPSEGSIGNANSENRIPNEYLYLIKDGVDDPLTNKLAAAIQGFEQINEYDVNDQNENYDIVYAYIPDAHAQTADDMIRAAGGFMEANIFVTGQSEPAECLVQQGDRKIWHLTKITNATQNVDHGKYEFLSTDGLNVEIYFMDSGIFSGHREFRTKTIRSYTVLGLRDEISNAINNDASGHGTAVAGIALGENFGVAKHADIVNVKVLNKNNRGKLSDVLDGLEWIYHDYQDKEERRNLKSPHSGNIPKTLVSIGFSTHPGDITDIGAAYITYLIHQGIPFVVPAGNSNVSACQNDFARHHSVISVGATDINNNLAKFSNWGPCVDIVAPGVDVYTASTRSFKSIHEFSGTSAAGAVVTGVAARILSQMCVQPSPAKLKQLLRDHAEKNVVHRRGRISTPNKFIHWDCDPDDYERCPAQPKQVVVAPKVVKPQKMFVPEIVPAIKKPTSFRIVPSRRRSRKFIVNYPGYL